MSDPTGSVLQMELVDPGGPVFEGEVGQVIIPARTGQLGIKYRHAPLVTQLAVGRLRVQKTDGEWLDFAVAEGFAKVQDNKVIVLADAAEEASEIDVDRVKQSLKRATERLEMYRTGAVPDTEDVDPYREKMARARALNRLRVAGITEE